MGLSRWSLAKQRQPAPRRRGKTPAGTPRLETIPGDSPDSPMNDEVTEAPPGGGGIQYKSHGSHLSDKMQLHGS